MGQGRALAAPAPFANGQRFLYNHGPERQAYSDPDASWGHRSAVSTRKGGGFYGYKLQLTACTRTGLPLAWRVETARHHESKFVAPLLDALHARGFAPETCAMDKGYDNNRVFDETRERGVVPIVCLRKGRAIPLTAIPYGSDEWKRLYRGRAAVEREFGRLKNEYGLTPLRTRGLARVRQHANLVMIARLGQALTRARSVASPPEPRTMRHGPQPCRAHPQPVRPRVRLPARMLVPTHRLGTPAPLVPAQAALLRVSGVEASAGTRRVAVALADIAKPS